MTVYAEVRTMAEAFAAANGVITMPDAPAAYPVVSQSAHSKPVINLAPDAERRWSSSDDCFWSSAPTCDGLPAGLYRTGANESRGPMLFQLRCDTDDLLELPDSAVSEVLDEIREFWKLEDTFKQRGFLHKRGVMLWGPPGSGKTAAVQQLISLVIKLYNGIALFIDHPQIAAMCLQMIRRIEPVRPIVAVMEDLDALIDRYQENEFLALLDGESQVNNIVFVSTTNYPETLDRRFTDRPSRFDTIKLVGMPNAESRKIYLLAKEPTLTENNEIDDWVNVSDGFSIAHLREMIILCKCYGHTAQYAAERLTAMRNELPNSGRSGDTPGGRAGFIRAKDMAKLRTAG